MQTAHRPIEDKAYDLSFSIAFLEHIPEDKLNGVIKELARVSKRGLHAPSFDPQGANDDPTHTTMRSAEWWEERFKKVAPDFPVKIVDKESLEFRGEMAKILPHVPKETRAAANLKKINFGS